MRVTRSGTKEFNPITSIHQRFRSGLFKKVDSCLLISDHYFPVNISNANFQLMNLLLNKGVCDFKNLHNSNITGISRFNGVGIIFHRIEAIPTKRFGEQVGKPIAVMPVVAHSPPQRAVKGIDGLRVQNGMCNFVCNTQNYSEFF